MIERIIKIIDSSEISVESGTLFCNHYIVNDIECLRYLDTEECFEQTIYFERIIIGNKIDLELSLHKLQKLGIFYSFEDYWTENKYYYRDEPSLYILELKCYSSSYNHLLDKYKAIVSLISGLNQVAKHKFSDVDIENVIINRDNLSIVLPFIYSIQDFIEWVDEKKEIIKKINIALSQDETKKVLFINELIDFLTPIEEHLRFRFLLNELSGYYNKCINAYQFYLSDFSDNKLRIELDSKALEYNQKIQSVINDSQTKLIAIPTAFILVFTTFDFSNLYSIKNTATMIGLFVFAVLIQLFIDNQKSTLNFIGENINSFRSAFKHGEIENISSRFKLVEKELIKQKRRFLIVETLLWLIPIGMLSLWLLLLKIKSLYVISLFSLLVYSFLIHLKC